MLVQPLYGNIVWFCAQTGSIILHQNIKEGFHCDIVPEWVGTKQSPGKGTGLPQTKEHVLVKTGCGNIYF